MRRMYSKPQLLEAVESESKLNGIKVFEDIKDKDGHARFIEGDITMVAETGVEYTYTKWSLSGSHLMFVVAGNVATGTALTGKKICNISLPQWIMDKIYPVFGNNIAYTQLYMYNEDVSSQNVAISFYKENTTNLAMYRASLTLTKDRSFRIQFDLLIDNE